MSVSHSVNQSLFCSICGWCRTSTLNSNNRACSDAAVSESLAVVGEHSIIERDLILGRRDAERRCDRLFEIADGGSSIDGDLSLLLLFVSSCGDGGGGAFSSRGAARGRRRGR